MTSPERILERDAAAARRERMIEAYLPMVRRLARRYARRAADVEDLEQAGSIGLIHAVDKFDPSRGMPFEAYATPTIAGEMLRHLRDRSTVVRIPRRVRAECAALAAAERELSGRLGRAPSRRELADRLAWPPATVEVARAAAGAPQTVPLDAAGTGPGEAIGADDAWPATDDRISVQIAMRALTGRDRMLVQLRFFEDLSQEEIARELGMSQAQVSRLIRSALDRLRGCLAA